ncbi:FecR family protein [Pedobacter sp.]|uniref:FecR family protein n=1 Tax=Pedobacter sp. TaxID=1411316 RepID=UPI003C3FEE81
MELQRIQMLISRYLEGRATEEEKGELEGWYAMLQSEGNSSAPLQINQQEEYERMVLLLPTTKKIRRIKFVRFTGWAAAIVILSFLLWPSVQNFLNIRKEHAIAFSTQDALSHSHVVLTLSNGKKINIDQQSQGLFQPEEGFRLTKAGSALKIEPDESLVHNGLNKLSTPARRRYTLQLPDGSRIWLNAGSSIRFPNHFNPYKRMVEVEGEVYFEVASQKNAHGKVPFIVSAKGQQITVLGTSFNVNTYQDSLTITTLVEGLVRIEQKKLSLLLKPGEAASSVPGKLSKSSSKDIKQTTTWRSGIFRFEKSNIEHILNTFAHWYGVQVIYRVQPPKELFSGKIPMDLPLNQALEIIKPNDFKFVVDGGKIYFDHQ